MPTFAMECEASDCASARAWVADASRLSAGLPVRFETADLMVAEAEVRVDWRVEAWLDISDEDGGIAIGSGCGCDGELWCWVV